MNAHEKFDILLKLLVILTGNRSYSLAELAQRFERSERTIYRFISSFRTAGFVIECNNGLYKIPKLEKPFRSLSELLHFSEEEAWILTRAIHSIDDNNLLKTNLINKLYSLYNFDRVAETIVKKENIESVHNLLMAIRQKKQVLLRQYRSSHGQIIRDRLVEPFNFTTNYTFVWAFDPESHTSKLFRVSRIGEVQILPHDFRHESLHCELPVDVFRISSPEQYTVKLILSLRAYNLLIEEYPLAEKYITFLPDNQCQFTAPVCGFEGVGRFVLGLADEIQIIEPELFKQYLTEKIKNLTPKIICQ